MSAFTVGFSVLVPPLLVVTVLLLQKARRAARFEAELMRARLELMRLQDNCARLSSATVVDRVAAGEAGSLAQRKEVTALFVDIVGFTAMSERLEATVLAHLLNGYYERVSSTIAQHRGHVSTFVGDGVVSFFGAFQPNPWQCNDAVRAALAIMEAMRTYNDALQRRHLPPVAVGIGIHRGPVLAGLMGPPERMEYVCVGRTVNLAARVQALTRIHGVTVLLTDAVKEHLDPLFALAPLAPALLKGIAEPVQTYTLKMCLGSTVPGSMAEAAPAHS